MRNAMFGTTIILGLILLFYYSVSTRKTHYLNYNRLYNEALEKDKKRMRDRLIKRKIRKLSFEPKGEDSELELIMKSHRWPFINCGHSLLFLNTWGTKNTMKRRFFRTIKSKNSKILGRVAVCLIAVFLVGYLSGNWMSIGLMGAAFTSKANGDIDVAGQVVWNEVGVPGSGDTAQLNHIIRIDNGTGNWQTLSFDIQAGGELAIDSEASGALSFTFDDDAAAGVGVSAGTLTISGSLGNLVTLTSAGSPPTNYWDFTATSLTVVINYGVIEYFDNYEAGSTAILYTVFQNAQPGGEMIRLSNTVTIFDYNIVATSAGQTTGIAVTLVGLVMNHVTITGDATDHIASRANNRNPEMVFCTFDFSKIDASFTNAHMISKDHGGVANVYLVSGTSSINAKKTEIANDWGSADNVTFSRMRTKAGGFRIDEAAANNNVTINGNSTLFVNGSLTWTFTNTGTLTITSGATLTFNGSAGNLTTLVSDSGGTQFSMNAISGSTVNVSYVDVTDCDASAGDAIDATDGTSVGRTQNNLNWDWPPVAGGGGGGPNTKLILPLVLS